MGTDHAVLARVLVGGAVMSEARWFAVGALFGIVAFAGMFGALRAEAANFQHCVGIYPSASAAFSACAAAKGSSCAQSGDVEFYNACGVSDPEDVRWVVRVYTTSSPPDSDTYIYQYDQYNTPGTCPAPLVLVEGLCVAEEPAVDCTAEGLDGFQYCTRPSLGEAQGCVGEGAFSDIGGGDVCLMEPCPGSVTVTVNNQVGPDRNCWLRVDGTVTCVAELCAVGDSVDDPGTDQQLDSAEPEPDELATETETTEDCSTERIQNRSLTEVEGGVESCITVTEIDSGAGCPVPGEIRETETCTLPFPDGSVQGRENGTVCVGESCVESVDRVTVTQPGAEPFEEDGRSAGVSGCQAPPSCSGDPIACAQLEFQWLSICADPQAFDAASEAFGTAADSLEDEVFTDGIDVSDTDVFDQSGRLDAERTCPVPESAVVMGQTLEMPFDLLCSYAEFLSYLILAVASYRAGRVIFGAF